MQVLSPGKHFPSLGSVGIVLWLHLALALALAEDWRENYIVLYTITWQYMQSISFIFIAKNNIKSYITT